MLLGVARPKFCWKGRCLTLHLRFQTCGISQLSLTGCDLRFNFFFSGLRLRSWRLRLLGGGIRRFLRLGLFAGGGW